MLKSFLFFVAILLVILADSIKIIGEFRTVIYVVLIIMSIFNLFSSWSAYKRKYAHMSYLYIIIILLCYKNGNIALESVIMSLLIYFTFITTYISSFKVKATTILLLSILLFSLLFITEKSAIGRGGTPLIFSNPNMASLFVLCVFSAVLIFYKNRNFHMFIMIVTLFLIVLTGSRGALLFYMISSTCILLEKRLIKYQNYFSFITFGFLVMLFIYLSIIEPLFMGESHFNVMGKEGGSAGRSVQILYLLENYEINLWGYGSLINEELEDKTGMPVHNFYISTLYNVGLLMFVFYIFFILKVYYSLKMYSSRVLFLCYHIYFFFEPAWAFCAHMNYILPMLIILGYDNAKDTQNNKGLEEKSIIT